MPDLGLYGPLIAFAILILAIFARDGLRAESGIVFPRLTKQEAGYALGSILVLVVLVLWNQKSPGYEGGLPSVLAAFVGGVFASCIAVWLSKAPGQANAGRLAPIALAGFTVACLELLGPNAPLAAVFGAASAAWLLGLGNEVNAGWAVRTTIYLLSIYACDALALQLTPPVHNLGVLLAVAATIAGILGLAIGSFLSKGDSKLAFAGPVLAFALLSLGGFLLFRREGMDNAASIAFIIAALLAALIGWVVEEEKTAVVRMVVGAVLWVALATAVFGYGKTLGMAIALTGACLMAGIFGKERALLTLGPLGALVIYRLFRILHPETAVAFDIGQHYALIGFLLGVMIPILAVEWQRSTQNLKPANSWSSGALWVFLIAAAPVPIAVTLSDKGIVGYLIGLGLAPIVDALRGTAFSRSLSLSLGLSCAMVFLYDWVSPYTGLDRAGKLHALIWILSIMAIAAIAIALLSRQKAAKAEA